jgi:hypothetical protein
MTDWQMLEEGVLIAANELHYFRDLKEVEVFTISCCEAIDLYS